MSMQTPSSLKVDPPTPTRVKISKSSLSWHTSVEKLNSFRNFIDALSFLSASTASVDSECEGVGVSGWPRKPRALNIGAILVDSVAVHWVHNEHTANAEAGKNWKQKINNSYFCCTIPAAVTEKNSDGSPIIAWLQSLTHTGGMWFKSHCYVTNYPLWSPLVNSP